MRERIPWLSPVLIILFLAACAPVDLNAPMPAYQTGVDAGAWAQIPAGSFLYGQHDAQAETAAYEIMVTDVTVAQYADFLNAAFQDGSVKLDGSRITGF